MAQHAEVYDYVEKRYVQVPLPARQPRRPGGKNYPHLDECLLFSAPDLHCTCDDDSPEWTI
jgi:hypothetical protein